MEEEAWVQSMYKRLMRTKNTESRRDLLRGITEDQNRRLTAFIKKKNKIDVTKKVKIKTEKKQKCKAKTIIGNYHVLVDYTNINYDLSLTNYVGRLLRINKIIDTARLTKALHLYMNILCGIIFKKFSFENKGHENNKNLLIFLKQLFPVEFAKYEAKYIERWAPNLNMNLKQQKKTENVKISNEDINRERNTQERTDRRTVENILGNILLKNDINGIIKKERENIEEQKDSKPIAYIEKNVKKQKTKTDEEEREGEEGEEKKKTKKKKTDSNKPFVNKMTENSNEFEGKVGYKSNKQNSDKTDKKNYNPELNNMMYLNRVKIEKTEECKEKEKIKVKIENDINDNDKNDNYMDNNDMDDNDINDNDINDTNINNNIYDDEEDKNEKILQNKLLYFIQEELGKGHNSNDEKELIIEITSLFYDEKRFDYRDILRNTVAKHLDVKEYREFCNLRDKLFKYKRSSFARWIQPYTKIKNLDVYILKFFMFLFMDRINIIIETYIRLNYTKEVNSCERFVNGFRKFCTIDEMLEDFCTSYNKNSVLENNLQNSTPSDTFCCPNKQVSVKNKKMPKIESVESNDVKSGNTTKSQKLYCTFNEKYYNVVKENETNFFLSIELIYSLDVYHLKVRNRITFEKLVDTNMDSYINESNIYELISFKKGKDVDPWAKLVQFVANQNKNMKLQKFDYFTVFMVSRFKFYLEEFKEHANIDYIYKTVKEEFDEVENFVTCKTNNPDFEHGHLVPLYISIKREVQKAQEYIRFYGNLTSFVNFIEKFVTPCDGPCLVKREKVEGNSTTEEQKNSRYFDLPFFLNSVNVKVKKEKSR